MNKITEYFDSIGLTFFLLHNCIGCVVIEGLYYVLFNEQFPVLSLVAGVIIDLIVITLYSKIIGNPLECFLLWISSSIQKIMHDMVKS